MKISKVAPIVLSFVFAAVLLAQGISPQSVGGEFGRNWLSSLPAEDIPAVSPDSASSADSSASSASTSDSSASEGESGLWSWGHIPKGQMLVGGVLEPIGDAMWFYPAFEEDNTTLLINGSQKTKNLTETFTPEMVNDPWMISQSSGRPVLVRL